jgi:hypothetical protein
MLDNIELSLDMSSPAQRRLEESLRRVVDYEPVVVLALGRKGGEDHYEWRIGLHNRAIVEGTTYQGLAATVSGVQIVIPQEHEPFIATLHGALIDDQAGALVVVSPDGERILVHRKLAN